MDAVPASLARSARRLSGALSAMLAAGLLVWLSWYTQGFEVWTFEARRQVAAREGGMQAAVVPVRLAASDGTVLQRGKVTGVPAVAVHADTGAGNRGAAATANAVLPWSEPQAGAKAYLVDFIYTRCPTVCLALGSEFQQAQRAVAQDPAYADVRLLSVSFDVENDSPAALASYATSLRADPEWWTFAVPSSAANAEALLRSLGVVVIPDGMGGFVHNGSIHLLDGQGRLRGLYGYDGWPQALADARRVSEETRP